MEKAYKFCEKDTCDYITRKNKNLEHHRKHLCCLNIKYNFKEEKLDKRKHDNMGLPANEYIHKQKIRYDMNHHVWICVKCKHQVCFKDKNRIISHVNRMHPSHEKNNEEKAKEKTRNKKRYAENIEETRKRLRKNEEEIPEPLLMAVEFGRIEEIKNASFTYDENLKPKIVYLDNVQNNSNDETFRKIKIYKCMHDNCDFFDTDNSNWRGLLSHMAMHTRVRNRHMKLNNKKTDFNCPFCKRTFRTLEKLLRHVEGKKCRENNSTKTNKDKFNDILNENW